jgi:voltage-gated potassium channel
VATAILLYLVGLACFPYAIGQILEYLVEGHERRRRGMNDLRGEVRDHLLIVNFPNAQKVRRIIAQFRGDPLMAQCPLVIVAEELETLPFEEKNVHFVRGSPEESETLLRANLLEARAAIILGPHTDRRTSDAMTAAAVSVIEGLNPHLPTVAECASVERLDLFRFCKCDSTIPVEDIVAKLLVQEVQDPGVAPFLSELLSTELGSEFFSEVTQLAGWTFGELLVGLARTNLRLIPVGLIRQGQKMVNPPPEAKIEAQDRVVCIGYERPDWPQVEAQLRALAADAEK